MSEECPAVALTTIRLIVPTLRSGDGQEGKGWGRLRVAGAQWMRWLATASEAGDGFKRLSI
jgi:hypothetical protein